MRKLLITLLMSAIVCSWHACKDKNDFKLEDSFSFINSEVIDTIEADGKTRLPLTVSIPSNADQDKQAVVFKTDIGTFDNDTDSQTANPDLNGNVIVFIKSSTTDTGLATIEAKAVEKVVRKQVYFKAATPLAADSNIQFLTTQDAAIADDTSRIQVLVQVHPKSNIKSVTFKTSLGTIIDANPATVNSSGQAFVFLKSENPGTARVTAEANNFISEKLYTFTPKPTVPLDSAIQFITTQDQAPADNNSLIQVLVQTHPLSNIKEVTFKATSVGSFVSTDPVTVNSNGQAFAFLKSDKPGIATVTATGNGFTSQKNYTFTPVATAPADSAIRFLPTQNTLEADGSSSIQVLVQTHPLSNISSVTFKSTNGSLTNTSATVDSKGQAFVFLSNTHVGTTTVTAEANGFIAQNSYAFTTAYPDQVALNIPQLSLSNKLDQKMVVTARLSRITGTPTANQTVTFSAIDGNNNPIGQFANQTLSKANGEATADFGVLDTTFTGNITLRVQVNTPSGIVEGTAPLLITQ